MEAWDADGYISGSLCLAAGLSEKDPETAHVLLRACVTYYAKGAMASDDGQAGKALAASPRSR